MSELLGRIRRVYPLPLGGAIRQLLVYDDQFLLVKVGKLDGFSPSADGTDLISAATSLALVPLEAILASRASKRAAKWVSMSPADWQATGNVAWHLPIADIRSARYGRKYGRDRLVLEDKHGKTRAVAWEPDPNANAAPLLEEVLGATLQPLKT